ncbi:hypothetical protein DL546_005432 [Coniochaeta pulveracea]|uniref:BZIP domain-containing protein n=1 Tax=Coniochaeta pulveracea TaxID=177199 RepID=A0A420YC84_9PEZI|nr:hypothetical protein DL546_005432 [Coniochaeta pulveracea]
MDYSQAYFGGGQPFPNYIGVHAPPLTPSHSNSAGSDDFATTSPPDAFDHQFANGIPHNQFSAFDSYTAPFNHQQQHFPGPPTPPSQHPVAVQRVIAQPQPGLNAASIAPELPLLPPLTKQELEEQAQSRRQGSNSDEDELTPAQSRRKAQNRAAQRAFRERKERHVKDLEAKLAAIEAAAQKAATENERLKRDLQKVNTENEILRATGGAVSSPNSNGMASMTTGPMSYSPTDFYSNVLEPHTNKTISHRVVKSDAGEKLLAVGAAWDLITSHELFKRGMVDVADVSERIRHQAKCDGQGPVFEESTILQAIEESAAAGSDDRL